jgi:protein tyrosine/serine phosphatase
MKMYFIFFTLFLTCFLFSCFNNSLIRNGAFASKIKGTTLTNFYQLNDSIYRSEQPDSKAFQNIERLGIKTILNLRSDRSDTILLRLTKLNYRQIKMVTKDFSDLEIIEALRIIRNSPKPLLIHCKHGADRTGVVVAMYRIIFENWSRQNAIDELKHGGYGFHKKYVTIPTYLKNVDTAYIKQNILAEKSR